MRETWTSFASNTTLHGLRYIVSTSGFRRLFWSASLLASLACAFYILYDGVNNFISLPVSTMVSSETPHDGMDFPDLTICNLNAFLRSKVEVGNDDPLIKELRLKVPACDVIRNISGNLTCGQALLCAHELSAVYVIRDCDAMLQAKLRDALNTSSRVFNPEDFTVHFGNGIKKMLLPYCRFGSVRAGENSVCTAADFDQVLTNNGVCFTFNTTKFFNRTGSEYQKMRIAGPRSGLSVMLNAHLDDMLMGDWSSGFRVIANQRGKYVNTDEGFLVSPGTHTLVTLQGVKYTRLPAPYISNCTEQADFPGLQVYSKIGCIVSCIAKNTVQKCGCRPVASKGYPGVPVCSTSDEDCMDSVTDKLRHPDCNCNLPCNEMQYEPRISTAAFPNKMVLSLLKNYVKLGYTAEYVKENLVFLQVSFSTIEYKLIKMQPAYTFPSLLSDIGGCMGLLLGFSVMTGVEFLDFLFLLILEKIKPSSKVRRMETETADQAKRSPLETDANRWTTLQGIGSLNQELN